MLQIRVLVQLYHLLDDLIVAAIEVTVVFVDLRVVTGLLNNPLLFLGIKLTLELPVIFKDCTLRRVVVTVSNVIGSLRNFFRTTNIVGDKSQAVGA